MNAIFANLAEDHRDALVAYYLGQIVPQHPVPAGRGLVTEQDLYEFLLIDNQVSAKVDTSRIAMGMASVQLYLARIFTGVEPGYLDLADGNEQRQWRVAKSEYSIWGANQMLQDYPENYLVPGLRLKQTEAFREFIGDTEQSRISQDSVQRALQHYLDKFERISNLEVTSGYIDGMDFRKSDYYFIGRQNVEPRAWFWRKAAVYFGDAEEGRAEGDDYLSPTAWGEWMPVEVPKGHEVVNMRPMVLDGRLYAVWGEHRREQRPVPAARAEVPGLMEEVSRYAIKLSYRTLDGTWSVPMTYELSLEEEVKYPRLFAYVNHADPQAKKIIIGFAANKDLAIEGLALDTRFNVLYQGLVAKKEGEGDTLLARLVNGIRYFVEPANVLQHPMMTDKSQNTLVREVPDGEHAVAGPVNGTLRLSCDLGAGPTGSQLWLQGRSSLRLGYQYPSITEFEMRAYQGDTELWALRSNVELNGSVHSPSRIQALGAEPLTVVVGFPDPLLNSFNQYEIAVPVDLPKAPLLVTSGGGQYLDLENLGLQGLRYVRLNTLFAKELVARAMVSVDALISWDTQHIEEPKLPGSTDVQIMDFHGANGRYFWELFFHIPHALAWRLHHEFDFQGAEQWLHYIFNPQARVKPTNPPSPFYWGVRPLSEPGRGEYEIDGIADPDAICYSEPRHYRKGIFALYVRNLLAYGDLLYRRLTRDSLNEAMLNYVRALSLLGPRPDNRMIGRWQPVTLEEAAKADEGLFAEIETQLPLGQPLLQACNGTPWLELLDSQRFRLPVNTHLLDLWDQLESRVSNLRNNLTIDGKRLMLPLYAKLADPLDLLRAQNSGSGLMQRSVGSLAPVLAFRFNALLPRLQGAVETLSRFGEQVRLFREMKDRAQQEELQQSHVLELSQFALQLQEVALEQADATLLALEASRRVIDQRRVHYEALADENVSAAEEQSMDLHRQSSIISVSSQAVEATAGSVNTAASIIATAFGGGLTQAGAVLHSSAQVINVAAGVTRHLGDRLAISEQYRRRQQEWLLQRDQAAAELDTIDEQIVAQRSAIEMVRVQIAQAGKAEQQAQDYYRFLKTRSTNAGLYQWLLSQMSTFYYQAYDAVVGLCLNGEASWQYEMGDYQTRFIQPNVWFDNHFGLTAGDALRLQLLRMESAWLKRFERRLELVRTVSLKQLFSQPGSDRNWDTVLNDLIGQGVVNFELAPKLFDSDYPGHYLRQLVSVSVSLPALVGPYQDVRAVLTQVSSRTVLKPDPRAMNELYNQPDKDPTNILYNPRASQSVCLSRGIDDHGMFQLDFNDQRYLAFEGTGLISMWELRFPRHAKEEQKAMLESLTDIIVQVRYTALAGGPDFVKHVEGLLGD